MRYLSGEEVLIIHSEIIDKTGGSHGIRDTGLLVSVVEKPKMSFGGKELYQGVFNKVAVYLESLTRYHIFIDGNKRVGIGASARFLFLNGLELTAANKEVENFVLKVVTKKLDLETIAAWFKKHSRKM